VRIVTQKAIGAFVRKHPAAGPSLRSWLLVAKRAQWSDLQDVRRSFPSADGVTVKSGRIATVFNIAGNKFRLITAIHYNRQIVFVMRFLTHAEYSKDKWKEEL
jgi:mRNA interferase HigB